MIQNENFGYRVRTARGTFDVSSTVKQQAIDAARILAASEEMITALERFRNILDTMPSGSLRETGPSGAEVTVSTMMLRGFVNATLDKLEG